MIQDLWQEVCSRICNALDISSLIWEERNVIAKNAYWIYFLPNVMESLVSYSKGMCYHVSQVIGGGLLNYTLLYDYRYRSREL